MLRAVSWLIAVLVTAPIFGGVARAEEEVRIAILLKQKRVEIGGRSLAVYDAGSGERLVAWPNGGKALVVVSKGMVELRPVPGKSGAGAGAPSGVGRARKILIEAKGGVRVGTGVYLGRLEIGVDEPAETFDVINRLAVETYLLGIVGSEMSPEWPNEALKAQAVAARTYAMQRRMMMRAANRPYDLESSVISQVYKGAERIRPSVIRAVKETRGEVMSYQHGLVEALFHSTCGGKTSSAKAAFGRSVPYLVPEPCRWCRDSTRHRWRLSVPLKTLSQMLEGARLSRGKVNSVERPDGATTVRIREKKGGRSLSPRAVRQAMGVAVLYSEQFTAKTSGSTVQIEGAGFGHGVGMCQWGARGLALEGKSYRDILGHYYRGVRVQRIY